MGINKVLVNRAKPGDGAQIAEILKKHFPEEGSAKAIGIAIDNEATGGALIIVARHGQAIVGVALAGAAAAWITGLRGNISPAIEEDMRQQITEIAMLAVKQTHRGRGIGAALVALVERYIITSHLIVIFFDPERPHLEAIYRSYGYRIAPAHQYIAVHHPTGRTYSAHNSYRAAYKMLHPDMHAMSLGKDHIVYGAFG